MEERVDVQLAEGDLCAGRCAIEGAIRIAEHSLRVGENMVEEVVLEVCPS